jgi:PmbA protein
MSRSQFSYTRDQLIALSQIVIEHAARQGATAADTEISEGVGQNVSVRQGEIETIEYNKDKGAGVTVYIGQRRGHASTSDLSEAACKRGGKALTIAHRRRCAAGLPDADVAKDVPTSISPPMGAFRRRGRRAAQVAKRRRWQWTSG